MYFKSRNGRSWPELNRGDVRQGTVSLEALGVVASPHASARGQER